MISHLRVIDLTDHRGIFCAKVLSDLGADVIKVEPPGGGLARGIGPFLASAGSAEDVPEPERSLFWRGFATGQRSVVLDVEELQNREALVRLVASADFLIESFAPGYLTTLGLDYQSLRQHNPGLVMISITPFGQAGPRASDAATDLTGVALSGSMFLTGEPDRPPVRISHTAQFWLVGAAAGAAGAMVAHHHRLRTGEGQHVDVSCQQAMARTLSHAPQVWDLAGINLGRSGAYRMIGDVTMRVTYACADGYVSFFYPGGAAGARSMAGLAEWMRSEGEPDSYIEETDWSQFEFGTTPQSALDVLEKSLSRFFAFRTKRQLADGAVTHRVILFPASDAQDLLGHPQLDARVFWQRLDGEQPLRHPGGFVRASGAVVGPRRRAPRLGEHTAEVMAEPALPRTARWRPPAGTTRTGHTLGAFGGVKVLDFCWVVIGPMLTRYLADFGATVVRVEAKSRMETLRLSQPFKDGLPGPNRSGYFSNYNMNKLGIALNMGKPGAIELAKRLVEWADIVTDNFTPGTMERWGLGPDDLRRINPGVVSFSASMLGSGGPHSAQPGYGPVLTSLAGFSYLTGWPERPPSTPYGAYTDFLLPHLGIAAITAALDRRQRTGEGTHIELSQLEGSLQYLSPVLLDAQANGRIAGREGNTDPGMAPHAVYRCAGDDRWCAIACEDDRRWRALCEAMGWPALANDLRFGTLAARKANETALDAQVNAWTSELDAHEVMARCQRAGVAAGVVQTTEELFADPQLRHRGHFVWLDHPEMGPHATDGNAFILSRTPAAYVRPAPLLGQHNEKVCRELLGMRDDEIAALYSVGALE
jgi:crotonobetainyl-CoA:carnitine CoA-transferase CaiB-like acyl-CoA transferase